MLQNVIVNCQIMMKPILVTIVLWFAFSAALAQNIKVIKYPQLLNMMKECDGEEIKVFNFWATWCKPCIEELPYLETLNEEYTNVQVSLICFDDVADLDVKVRAFVKEKELKSAVFLLDETDYNSFIDLVDPRWTGAIPATVIVKCADKSKYFFERPFKENELNDIVDQL